MKFTVLKWYSFGTPQSNYMYSVWRYINVRNGFIRFKDICLAIDRALNIFWSFSKSKRQKRTPKGTKGGLLCLLHSSIQDNGELRVCIHLIVSYRWGSVFDIFEWFLIMRDDFFLESSYFENSYLAKHEISRHAINRNSRNQRIQATAR